MKKFLLFVAVALGFSAANAQTTVEGSKFFDNTSVTIKAGAISPLHGYKVVDNTRGLFGVELRKDLTPVFGLGLDFSTGINTTSWDLKKGGIKSPNVFDGTNLVVEGITNWSNLIGGYKGSPRLFEIESVLGLGWAHKFYPCDVRRDDNSMTAKAGLNLNFNLGESKAWTVALKPAVVWNLLQPVKQSDASFNANYGYLELTAGVTYHFKNSNGTHHFKLAELKDQAEIDALNGRINDLRAELAQTKAALDECNNRPAQVKEVVKEVVKAGDDVPATVITFAQGKSGITKIQYPNIQRIADYLNQHKDAKATIYGYASPEGGERINNSLAENRAQAVKSVLVNKFGIDASRISAAGQGVGEIFDEPTWNRVAVCSFSK